MDWNNFISPITGHALKKEGDILKSSSNEQYPITNQIPRFVPNESFASAFGLQWNTYSTVQLDSANQTSISEDRVQEALDMPLSSINGIKILEAGSGAGRFTEILLKYGALVYSFDLSEAVDANLDNNSTSQNLTIFQGDIEHIPFKDNFFDICLCLGVMQHTRDSKLSLKELARVVKSRGLVSFDHYERRIGQYLSLYLMYWTVIKRMPLKMQLRVTEILTDIFFPVHWFFRNHSFIQFLLRRISPISFYYGMFTLTKEQHYEASRLDTHDKNTDHFKRMVSEKQLNDMVEVFNFHSHKIFKGGTGLQCIITK